MFQPPSVQISALAITVIAGFGVRGKVEMEKQNQVRERHENKTWAPGILFAEAEVTVASSLSVPFYRART